MNVQERVRQFIEDNKDENKAIFDASLITTNYPFKGLSVKLVEKFAKELAKEDVNFNELLNPISHDEVLVTGMYIAYCNCTAKTKVRYLKKYMPLIDNWATCDMIVSRLKGLESEQDFFVSLLQSTNPFYIRFGIVWLMKNKLKTDLRETVNILKDNVKNRTYYVEMALAWCYAEALILDYDYMIDFVQNLERFVVRNRTLQKACDSTRFTPEQKKEIRAIRSRLLGMEI